MIFAIYCLLAGFALPCVVLALIVNLKKGGKKHNEGNFQEIP